MPAIQQPDFNNIFASAAALGEIINWPAEDYLEGWGYLNNNEPPPMEYFNAYFNGTDNKLLYLFESVNIRKNNTAYQIDDIITSPNLSSKFYLVCTQAGTTDANEPDYTNASINQEITDGTTKWLVVRKSGNMEAATAEADGKGGMVPAPKAGDEDSFLSGSATYVPIATQTEAEAQENQNNKKPMTPLRVYQAIVAYFTQFLAAAVFTGIVKAVAPAAASNDNSVPTTSWVRTCFESMAKTVAEILEIQWKTEATGYLLLGPYLGNLKILWGFYYESQSDTDYRYLPITPVNFVIPVLGKSYYVLNETEYVPYYQQISLNSFLTGYGNNRAGSAYVPVLVIAV